MKQVATALDWVQLSPTSLVCCKNTDLRRKSVRLVYAPITYSDGIPRKGLKLSLKELPDCSSNTAIVRLFKTVASLF